MTIFYHTLEQSVMRIYHPVETDLPTWSEASIPWYLRRERPVAAFGVDLSVSGFQVNSILGVVPEPRRAFRRRHRTAVGSAQIGKNRKHWQISQTPSEALQIVRKAAKGLQLSPNSALQPANRNSIGVYDLKNTKVGQPAGGARLGNKKPRVY